MKNLLVRILNKLKVKTEAFLDGFRPPDLRIIDKNSDKTILLVHYINDKNLNTFPKTVLHHLFSFEKYSKSNIHYVHMKDFCKINLDGYDAVVVHYYSQVYLHLTKKITKKFKNYRGKKIFFVQDDYDEIPMNRKKYIDCKIDLLYTPVDNRDTLDFIYPPSLFNNIQINTYLTGYCEPSDFCDVEIKSIKDRQIDIFYRGNDVGLAYGQLGQDKYDIGVKLIAMLEGEDIKLDISCAIKDQIYGNEYFDKMRSAKATLITESGSSIIFDDRNLLKQRYEIVDLLRSKTEEISLNDLKSKYLDFFKHEGRYTVAVISPKVFEAIMCKTVLIGFKGNYSGVLKPDYHYIVLNKDFSNLHEVMQKLLDNDYLQIMADRAYQDIFLSGKYSYQTFIDKFDAEVFPNN